MTGICCTAKLRQFLRNRDGNAATEFAVVVMILAVLGVGMFDFGRYGLAFMRAHSAARAGTQYGVLGPVQATNYQGMIDAAYTDAQVDPNAGTPFLPAARRFCMCPGTTAAISCTDTAVVCADGGYKPLFVEVTIADSFDLFFDYPGLAPTLPVSATSRMRVN